MWLLGQSRCKTLRWRLAARLEGVVELAKQVAEEHICRDSLLHEFVAWLEEAVVACDDESLISKVLRHLRQDP